MNRFEAIREHALTGSISRKEALFLLDSIDSLKAGLVQAERFIFEKLDGGEKAFRANLLNLADEEDVRESLRPIHLTLLQSALGLLRTSSDQDDEPKSTPTKNHYQADRYGAFSSELQYLVEKGLMISVQPSIYHVTESGKILIRRKTP